jgi:uncharacterized membrane protein (UPF0127 family)
MNNQLKLLIYIALIAGIFFYIQDSFDLFDVSFVNTNQKAEELETPDEEESTATEQDENYVEIFLKDGGKILVDVEVADTDALRTLGLSNRRYLGDYNGMLFIFDQSVSNPFWMKDTFINLDIIFIDEKKFIVDIKDNNEPCIDDSCPHIFSSSMYKYVLEVNGGFCEDNGVEVGQSIQLHLESRD